MPRPGSPHKRLHPSNLVLASFAGPWLVWSSPRSDHTASSSPPMSPFFPSARSPRPARPRLTKKRHCTLGPLALSRVCPPARSVPPASMPSCSAHPSPLLTTPPILPTPFQVNSQTSRTCLGPSMTHPRSLIGNSTTPPCTLHPDFKTSRSGVESAATAHQSIPDLFI